MSWPSHLKRKKQGVKWMDVKENILEIIRHLYPNENVNVQEKMMQEVLINQEMLKKFKKTVKNYIKGTREELEKFAEPGYFAGKLKKMEKENAEPVQSSFALPTRSQTQEFADLGVIAPAAGELKKNYDTCMRKLKGVSREINEFATLSKTVSELGEKLDELKDQEVPLVTVQNKEREFNDKKDELHDKENSLIDTLRSFRNSINEMKKSMEKIYDLSEEEIDLQLDAYKEIIKTENISLDQTEKIKDYYENLNKIAKDLIKRLKQGDITL